MPARKKSRTSSWSTILHTGRYTTDADGIRHGMMDVGDLTVVDARFALVTCSAFCSYLLAKAKAPEAGKRG